VAGAGAVGATAWLQQEYGLFVTIISVATAHHGLIYRGDGLDIPLTSIGFLLLSAGTCPRTAFLPFPALLFLLRFLLVHR
jgi:hypothetical protein